MIFYNKKFKELRKQKRWSITTLSGRCGVTRQTLARWETGGITPNEAKIRFLAQIMEINVSEISDIYDAPTVKGEDTSVFKDLFALRDPDAMQKRKEEQEDFLKALEKKYETNERMLMAVQAIIHSMPTIFYIKNTKMKYDLANNAFINHFKKDNPNFNIDGLEDQDFMIDYDAKKNHDEDLKVLRKGKPVINREDYIPGTRRTKWGLITKTPVYDHENRIMGILGNIIDISPIKEFELIKHLIEEALSKIDITLSIYNDDDDNKSICYLTGSLKNVFGIDPKLVKDDQVTNYWLNNIVHPDDRENQKRIYDSKNPPSEREYRIIHPEKGERKIKTILYKTKYSNKKYSISLSIDVTQIKDAVQQNNPV